MKRYLITTALPITWPDGLKPVIFLGEWCKLYSKRSDWECFDSITFPYHWMDRVKFQKDYEFLNNLLDSELLPEVGRNLNEIHEVNYSSDYWRILIGPWLGYFTQMVFDRFETIRLLKESTEFSLPTKFTYENDEVIPNDMADFRQLFVSDYWNQYLYDQVLDFFFERPENGSYRISRDVITPFKMLENHKSLKEKIKNYFYSLADFCVGKTEAFFVADYLPFGDSMLLQMMLGQIPRKRRENSIEVFELNQDLRNRWKFGNSKVDFVYLIKKLIPLQIPKVYLEGYSQLKEKPILKKWPSKPKFIFTSNSHVGDDLFKFWAAEKKESGTPLILSQHGGHYGTGMVSFLEDHEKKIADRYLTWGWDDRRRKNVIPNFSVKLSKKKDIRYNSKGIGLIVENAMPRYSYLMFSATVSSQMLEYFDDQFQFMQSLIPQIREQFTVRLYAQDFNWDQKARWKDRFPSLHYDYGQKTMKRLMEESRIYVSTYNATTFLESLGLNMPTLIFWNSNHWELRKDATPYFEMLKEAEILFDDPAAAASHLNKIWNDISNWWNQEKRQQVRKVFLERYCRRVEHPLRTLKTNLTI
ncbi:transferase, LIC12162 family protein [Leptospira yasudae]|uniref:LIC12162 family transferase n=1 Tax=Leptospira yasudae TaxID=2202201 RepID=UPI001C4F9FD8|nr:LIC12162 family protein [Leptospira yasudae]MBW0434120.1 transferase, LIC12162 family protein [Leptospira yasudae]